MPGTGRDISTRIQPRGSSTLSVTALDLLAGSRSASHLEVFILPGNRLLAELDLYVYTELRAAYWSPGSPRFHEDTGLKAVAHRTRLSLPNRSEGQE